METYHLQMLDPAIYPEPTRSVAFKETHISRIYLTDQTAYKLKKPLNLGFLDFSTLAKRHHFCREEVRLNKRFAPDTYLGVAPLREQDGRVTFLGRQGKIIDYAVRMHRLPEERMLNRMLECEAPDLEDGMRRLAGTVHRAIDKMEICRAQPPRNVAVVKHNCDENFQQTQAAIGVSLTRQAQQLMQDQTLRDIDALTELMRQREANGFVRDGHGDLHTRNICMTEPIRIYDCIEFNRRFRVADIAADLAFLLMDLEYRGRPDLASIFLSSYLDLSDDHDLHSLLPFYKRYRAWVRGKVETILASESDVDPTTRTQAAIRAWRYFNLAIGSLVRPSLYLVSGLMGVGKTTFARALSQATGAAHLRSDVTRKELAGLAPEQPCRDDYGAGLYGQDATLRTYDTLFERAGTLLRNNRAVIIDASFACDKQRQRFRQLAQQAGTPAWLLVLECPEAVAMQRLAQRTNDASDGRASLYHRQKIDYDAVVLSQDTLVIDSSGMVDYNVQSTLCRILVAPESQR